jgi:hypothetical protein
LQLSGGQYDPRHEHHPPTECARHTYAGEAAAEGDRSGEAGSRGRGVHGGGHSTQAWRDRAHRDLHRRAGRRVRCHGRCRTRTSQLPVALGPPDVLTCGRATGSTSGLSTARPWTEPRSCPGNCSGSHCPCGRRSTRPRLSAAARSGPADRTCLGVPRADSVRRSGVSGYLGSYVSSIMLADELARNGWL